MVYSPLTLARRHVLGEHYTRCEHSTNVPVYLNDASGEQIGYADESHGIYADAFTFHLPEDFCKRLAGGQYLYSFDFHFSESAKKGISAGKRRVKLVSIFLTMRKGYDKPVPKSARKAEAEAESVEAAT